MTRFHPRKVALLTGVLAAAFPALAASTPAGTVIVNQSSATFTPQDNGVSSVQSNAVYTTVQAVCAVSVTLSGSPEAALLPGEQTTLRFTLTNAGNASATLPLNVFSTGMTPSPTLKLYQDLNRNGLPDAGEEPVSSVTLAPDAEAQLLVVVQTSAVALGDALINLVTSCGGTGAGASATGMVSLSPPPVLTIHKTFTPALLKPGAETTVEVSTSNEGQGESREVILTDLLAGQLAQGLSYVSGSARASVGTLEYTSDGHSWSSAETQPVRGVRVRVGSLAPAGHLTLTFRMRAAESADGKVIDNTATADTGRSSVAASAQVDVRYQPGVAIGPLGQAQAPEGTPADTQTRPFAVVGQQVCFDHTLQNTGDVRDTFTITVTYPQGGAKVNLYGADGQALAQPLPLDPEQTALVRVCYTPTQTGALEALITASGARGTRNTTKDRVSDIQSGLPELKKTYAATGKDAGGQPRDIAAGATVAVGDTITYTLSVHNPYPRPLNSVVISDPVAAHLEVTGASNGGTVRGEAGAQTVTWNLGTLAAGETRTLTIVTRVSARAVDGEALKNIFNLTSTEFTTPLSSNEVSTPVWNAALNVQKTVSSDTVTYGDKVTYTLTIKNTSATTAIESALVTDTPAQGLQYLAGSSTLDGQALQDPTRTDSLQWQVGTIPAGGQVVIKYDMRVTPDAATSLLNEVQVVGVGAGGAARAIASNHAQRTIRLDPLKFAPLGDLIGTVFVDRNRNGLYDAGLDTPVERARVILASGRLALTDRAGRYHFSNVPFGSWALRLDPNTTPSPPLQVPQDGGLSGTQTVQVRGLTSVNFPLAPLGGDIAALRRTTLSVGDVTIEKSVFAVDGGYVVTLKINSPRDLPDFMLDDPLPGGATLKEGRNTLGTSLRAGETILTYRFEWNGPASAATTDPVVRRY